MIGVYGGLLDKFPAGAWMNRSLTLRTGQYHVQRYMKPLLQRIERGEIDPTRIITQYEAARLLHQPVDADLATSSPDRGASRDCGRTSPARG